MNYDKARSNEFRSVLRSVQSIAILWRPRRVQKKAVSQYTWGRTEHLHEMKRNEYDELCKGLEKILPNNNRDTFIKEMKRKRSAVLHQMQLYGVDTSNWARVNSFCMNPRIAGKEFRELDGDELDALLTKMRMIRRKKDNQ